MKTILLVGLTLGLAMAPRSAPHKFEDGFVERTLAIVIRDNVATAEYSIGLNESTLNDLLQHWKNSEEAAGIKEPTDLPALPETSTPLPTQSSEQQSSDKSPAAPVSNTQTNDEPAEKIASSPESESAKTQPTTAPAETSGSDDQSSDLENPIHEQLLAELQKSGPTQIARQILITCQGKPLEIKNISASPAPRHPFNLVVRFEFEIPAVKSAQLLIEDQNFRQQTGAVRYAIKALGGTMLVKSNVAPIIVRAQRRELAGLSKKESLSETSISAQILIMSNSEEDD